jgi:hypothetical protein
MPVRTQAELNARLARGGAGLNQDLIDSIRNRTLHDTKDGSSTTLQQKYQQICQFAAEHPNRCEGHNINLFTTMIRQTAPNVPTVMWFFTSMANQANADPNALLMLANMAVTHYPNTPDVVPLLATLANNARCDARIDGIIAGHQNMSAIGLQAIVNRAAAGNDMATLTTVIQNPNYNLNVRNTILGHGNVTPALY